MARSLWKWTLVSTFAWAGVALAQQQQQVAAPSSTTKSLPTLTIQEPGKHPQKCTVVQSWKTADGATAHLVQALDTSEMMTIVEGTAMTSVQGTKGDTKSGLSTRIYHWGRDRVPPAGAPLPPEASSRVVTTAAIGLPMPQAPIASSPEVKPATTVSSKPTTLPPATSPYANLPVPTPLRSAPVKTVVLSETIVPVVPSTTAGGTTSQSTTWSTPTTVIEEPQVKPPVKRSVKAVLEERAAMRNARIASTVAPVTVRAETASPAPIKPSTAMPVMAKAGTPITEQPEAAPKAHLATIPEEKVIVPTLVKVEERKPQVEVTSTTPGDWRESWGKASDHKSTVDPSRAVASQAVTRESKKPVEAKAEKAEHPLVGLTAKPIEPKAASQIPARLAEMQVVPGKAQTGAATRSPVTLQGAIRERKQVRAEATQREASIQETVIPENATPDIRMLPTPVLQAPKAPMPFGPVGPSAPTVNRALSGSQTITMNPGLLNAFQSMPTEQMVAQKTNAFTTMDEAIGQGMMPRQAQQPAMPPQGAMPANMMAMAGMIPPPPPALAAQMAQLPPQMQQMAMQQYIQQQHTLLMQQTMQQQRGVAPTTGRGMQQMQPVQPVTQARPASDVQPAIRVIKEAMLPSQREMAVEQLGKVDWKAQPQVVEALLTAAREDPAASVRSSCVRCLAKMQACTPEVLAVLHGLKTDRDATVCRDAELALSKLANGTALQPAAYSPSR